MIIEVHGAGFRNKGAEMMLRAASSELRSRINNVELAVDPLYGTYTERSSLNFLQIVPPRSHVGNSKFSKRFLRQIFFTKCKLYSVISQIIGVSLKKYGMIDIDHTHSLIDISGFAYSDQWGDQPTKDLVKIARYYKKRRKNVILLPQAFGPFDNTTTRQAFIEAFKYIDLIFARDKRSFEYLTNLFGFSEKIKIAPDITFFYNQILFNPPEVPDKYICIIPNVRIVDKGQSEWQDKYEYYILSIVYFFLSSDVPVFIIIHDDNGKDVDIAKRVVGKINNSKICVVEHADPLYLKYLISRSFMVIGSRYHSLIASLSSAVPSVCIGWSHKYAMLFEEFGCERFIITSEDTLDVIIGRIEELFCPEKNFFYREKIRQQVKILREKNEIMWKLVVDMISNHRIL